MTPTDLIFPALVYPGLLWVLAVVLVVALVRGDLRAAIQGLFALRGAQVPLAWTGALVCGFVALALLPWPNLTGGGRLSEDRWLLWTVIEGANLLLLLPGWQRVDPVLNQAVTREAQLTIVGRIALWLALGGLLLAPPVAAEGARICAVLATFAALPLALNWPPFGDGSGWLQRFPGRAQATARLLLVLRETLLVATTATFLSNVPGFAPWLTFGIQAAWIVGVVAIGRGLRGYVVRQRLGFGLRWALAVAVPLAMISVILIGLGI